MEIVPINQIKKLNKMEWIDVKLKPFADIEILENGGYTWESNMVEEPFMVAVPTKKGWHVERVILIDEIGLQCYCDGEISCFGYELTDVTHYLIISNPIIFDEPTKKQ